MERLHASTRSVLIDITLVAAKETRNEVDNCKLQGQCGSFVWCTAEFDNEAANSTYAKLGSFSEPLVAHAVFDEPCEVLATAGAARGTGQR